MKKVKMSFSNINDVLSRDEMRQIMAGSGEGYCGKCPGDTEYCYRDPHNGLQCTCNGTDSEQC